MFKRNFRYHLHTLLLYFDPGYVLMIFLNSNSEVINLIYSGNTFHMFALSALNLLFPNVLYFEYGCIDYAFYQ